MKLSLKALGQQIGEIIARRIKEGLEPQHAKIADLERRVADLEAKKDVRS